MCPKKTNQLSSKKTILWRGLCGRCPNCGGGELLKNYLTAREHCENCNEDLSPYRADDGPPWLTILVTGHLIAPLIGFFALQDNVPLWASTAMLASLGLISVFLLLPRAKGLFIAALWLIAKK
ncbi:MAG: DUF983 domain-containing protein [Alphaproteobacteria bacterium]|nr:DUF983 domain-containing protein [Alphaproteobacteria bacterium]